MSPDFLNGIPVISNEYIGEPKSRMVPRTWKESLFTRPWHPFRKLKSQMYFKDTGSIWMVDGKMVAHPDTVKKLKEKTCS